MTDPERTLLSEITDPAARAREVGKLLAAHAQALEDLAVVRKEAVSEMHLAGMTYRQIADAIDISPARVGQIIGNGWSHTLVARRPEGD